VGLALGEIRREHHFLLARGAFPDVDLGKGAGCDGQKQEED